MVLIKEEGEAAADIVDGQQRLTTLTILLSVLRNLSPPKFAAGFTEFLYERGNPVTRTPNRYRLSLREQDAEFFRAYIQDEGGVAKLSSIDPAAAKLSDSQCHIHANAILFINRLQKTLEEERVRLGQFIVEKCLLVVVTTPDLRSAYRIFSVLNNRGMDLSHADILKAELVGALPEEQQDEYGKRWETIEVELGRDPFADLLTHIRMIYRKAKQRDTILDEFREYVSKPVGNLRKLIEEVLEPYADAYADIKDARYTSTVDAGPINELLKWLRRIDNVDWYPPAILFMARNRSDPAALKKFFTALERLAIALMIRRANVNERIERYGRLLTAIENNDQLYEASSPLQLSPTECQEISTRLKGDLYGEPYALYVLLRLDSEISGGGAQYDYSIISIEHVLPQNPEPGSQWEAWFPDPVERMKRVHQLVNLLLLTRRKNSEANRFEFNKKKEKYFTSSSGTSPFVLTTQVIGEPTWTPEVIDRRQRDLLVSLNTLWGWT